MRSVLTAEQEWKGAKMSILIKNTTVEDLQRAMLMFREHEIIELLNHGDLIDREAVMTDLSKTVLEAVASAPVVIPAERSDSSFCGYET